MSNGHFEHLRSLTCIEYFTQKFEKKKTVTSEGAYHWNWVHDNLRLYGLEMIDESQTFFALQRGFIGRVHGHSLFISINFFVIVEIVSLCSI